MTTQEYLPATKFEQNTSERSLSTERMGKICITLADICIQYAGVERVPRYHEHHRENDAEHSLMLGIVAVELANELRPELDKGLISQYASVHDFPEICVGDTPTYNLSDQELLDKHVREQDALRQLIDILPPYTASLLVEYEAQVTPESVWTRSVDKVLPLAVDILGPGKMVMREDYGVTSVAKLLQNKQRLDSSMIRRFGEQTPEIVDLYQYLGDIFTREFLSTETQIDN